MSEVNQALNARLAAATTFLFVPADRPERVGKALNSDADVVIIDLEDSVAPGAKVSARKKLLDSWDVYGSSLPVIIRINSVLTPHFAADLELLKSLQPAPGIMLAQAESAQDIQAVSEAVSGPIIPLVESAIGWHQLDAITRASDVVRVALGGIDFALDVNSSHQLVLDQLRVITVLHSRAAGITAPVDSPVVEITDTEVASESAARARNLGMGGMLAIHPAQLAPIRSAFAPSEQEINWAQSVIEAAENNPGIGAFRLGTQMIDAPVIARAQHILERGREKGTNE